MDKPKGYALVSCGCGCGNFPQFCSTLEPHPASSEKQSQAEKPDLTEGQHRVESTGSPSRPRQ